MKLILILLGSLMYVLVLFILLLISNTDYENQIKNFSDYLIIILWPIVFTISFIIFLIFIILIPITKIINKVFKTDFKI